MKDFLKYTLATITGLIATSVIMGIVGIIMLAGIAAAGQTPKEVKDNTVFVLKLSGTLEERAKDNFVGQLTGQVSENIGLDDILRSIDKAKKNDKIKGIYIKAGMFASDSPASSKAIRRKLEEFRKSGKWIVAYADDYTQTTYYICSVADRVFLNPQGMLDWHGLAAQPMFYKDLLAKFGVKFQLAKVGKYKSMPEMMTADGMSEPNREQVTVYLNGIWNDMLDDVARSRKQSREMLNGYASSYAAFNDQKQHLTMSLINGLLYADEVKDELKKMLKLDADEEIPQVALADMINLPEKDSKGDEIAVYYAYGDIVSTNPGGLAGETCIASEDVCRDLDKLAEDDDVKAVVLRVNSGGGSAYASEQIWHSMMKLKAKKPVVVSMGGMAASGGYYISCPANYIYAEPTTLTGSIGIFGMFPDISGLLTDKLGIKFDEVKTNRNSGFGTPARPFNEEEMAMLENYVGRGYELFRKRVADGRKMKVEEVEAIAQGRVWLGQDGLKNKLVDALGGLDMAVAKAAELAKLKEHHTEAYPAKKTWVEQLMEGMVTDDYIDGKMKAALGEYYTPFMTLKNINRQEAIQARMPYHIIIK